MKIMEPDTQRANLFIAGDELSTVVARRKGTAAEIIALTTARAAIVHAHAAIDLAEQQRAANLLELARLTSGPAADQYVGKARAIIDQASA